MLEQILCPKDLTEDDFAHANCGHCIEFSPKLIKDGGVLYAKLFIGLHRKLPCAVQNMFRLQCFLHDSDFIIIKKKPIWPYSSR